MYWRCGTGVRSQQVTAILCSRQIRESEFVLHGLAYLKYTCSCFANYTLDSFVQASL